jgi:acetyltransferase-like isoleucine patch superfamily enzyme
MYQVNGFKMNIIKLLYSKLKFILKDEKVVEPFFTKHIFKNKKFEIGEFTYGNPTILFENEDANLTIGKYCSIANEVKIFLGGNHKTEWISTYPFSAFPNVFPEAEEIIGHPATKGNVSIGNDVWIGHGVIIMSGVTIGNGAVIAAGTLVTKDIGNYEIWGGNPSKLLKKRFDDQSIEELLKLKWWDLDISEIEQLVPILCSSNLNFLKTVIKPI